MKKETLLLLILAIVQFTHIVDFMIIMPLGAQFMRTFDISPRQFSFIVSVYAGAASISGLISALFIDRFDRKVALFFTYLGFLLGTLACALAPDYFLLLAARALAGAFGGVLGALIFSVIADSIPYQRRSAAMGIVMTAFSVASVVGVPIGIYLAAQSSWRLPFFAISGLAVIILLLIHFFFPPVVGHLENGKVERNPGKIYWNIISDPNQLKALLFTVVLMLGHFTIIPFIAPYMQLNIGFSDVEVTYIYAIGGALTAVLLPLFGRLADRVGNALIFTFASVFALFSIFAITNLPPVSMAVALCATSSFFIVASGRSVPATTMVTSVVRPESRGSFMSLRSSVNQLGLFLASFIAGLIVIENPDGSLGNYAYVGWIAIGMSLVAVVVAWQLKKVS